MTGGNRFLELMVVLFIFLLERLLLLYIYIKISIIPLNDFFSSRGAVEEFD